MTQSHESFYPQFTAEAENDIALGGVGRMGITDMPATELHQNCIKINMYHGAAAHKFPPSAVRSGRADRQDGS